MGTILISILIAIQSIVIVICFWVLYRNNRTCDFLLLLNKLCWAYNTRNFGNNKQCAWERWYNDLQYHKIMFSFKKCKLESFMSEEDIKELLIG